MSEAALQQAIRLDVGRERHVRLFRNNVGTLLDRQGRPVKFGLHPGSGDLIGWHSLLVTPSMVGERVAVLVSVEVKAPKGRLAQAQEDWLTAVWQAGGYAGVARSVADARTILRIPT